MAKEVEVECVVCGETAEVFSLHGWNGLPPGWLTRFEHDEDKLVVVCSPACAEEYQEEIAGDDPEN